MELLLLMPRNGPPPPPWVLLFVPVVFLLVSWLSNHLMGIDAMYKDWPADPNDPIERNLGWVQVEFGTFRGHSPMAIKFGRRCLHLKQPFPFQPAFWNGPASIPWSDVLLEKAPNDGWWAILSPAEFRLGQGGRLIRLRGKAAKALMARLRVSPAGPGIGPALPPGPGAIRPS
ncbi:MAG TPA: hypothetical protein VF378_04005 [Geothrix sp.]